MRKEIGEGARREGVILVEGQEYLLPPGVKIETGGIEWLRPGEIPSLKVSGRRIPEVWEAAVLAVLAYGAPKRTEYDNKEDPLGRAATLSLMIADPLGEPRIHRNFPTSLEDLWVYVEEVVNGVHDGWVRKGGWSYSYHERLRAWPGRRKEIMPVDQLEILARKLSEVPYSRRAQAITWFPPEDASNNEPPCLQRVWCQMVRTMDGVWLLEMNTHWRSRDILKAAFMNIFALTELQRSLAERIGEMRGEEVLPGRYVDTTDDAHVYGSDFRRGDVARFLTAVSRRSFESRVWETGDPEVQKALTQARRRIEKERNE